MMAEGETEKPDGRERRQHRRYDVKFQVDVEGAENFLFAYVSNISEMGIFVASDRPLSVGSHLKLTFKPIEIAESFEVEGEVVWVNPVREGDESQSPGMGIRFVDLDDEQKEKIVGLIKTIAYLHDHWV